VLSDEAQTASSAGLMSPLGRSTSSAAQRLQDQQAGAAGHGRDRQHAQQQEEQQEACSIGVPSVREAILGLQRRFGSLDLTMVPRPGQPSHAADGGAGSERSRAHQPRGQEVVQRAASVPAEPADALSSQLHRDGEQSERRLLTLRRATHSCTHSCVVPRGLSPHTNSCTISSSSQFPASWLQAEGECNDMRRVRAASVATPSPPAVQQRAALTTARVKSASLAARIEAWSKVRQAAAFERR